jgi:hypothetical protein
MLLPLFNQRRRCVNTSSKQVFVRHPPWTHTSARPLTDCARDTRAWRSRCYRYTPFPVSHTHSFNAALSHPLPTNVRHLERAALHCIPSGNSITRRDLIVAPTNIHDLQVHRQEVSRPSSSFIWNTTSLPVSALRSHVHSQADSSFSDIVIPSSTGPRCIVLAPGTFIKYRHIVAILADASK